MKSGRVLDEKVLFLMDVSYKLKSKNKIDNTFHITIKCALCK